MEKKQLEKVPRYRPPAQEQKEAYNQAIKEKMIIVADWFIDIMERKVGLEVSLTTGHGTPKAVFLLFGEGGATSGFST